MGVLVLQMWRKSKSAWRYWKIYKNESEHTRHNNNTLHNNNTPPSTASTSTQTRDSNSSAHAHGPELGRMEGVVALVDGCVCLVCVLCVLYVCVCV